MYGEKRLEAILITCFLVFSVWLMGKSFGYNPATHAFRIARHQVGDFGLHLSLIRSFSWGTNIPVESPFFPGKPLPYHYYFDLFVGLLERAGMRIDWAFNGVSSIAFTLLLYLIYKIPQVLFGKNKMLGILSVTFFIMPSSFTFIDFFRDKSMSLNLIRSIWFLPDYPHKGPFDGSIISIYFTLNTFLNQRHFIAALTIGFIIFLWILPRLLKRQNLSLGIVVLLAVVLGLLSRLHTLTALSFLGVISLCFLLFGQKRQAFVFFIAGSVAFSVHLKAILGQDTHLVSGSFFQPGFLTENPLTVVHFLNYWIQNLGLAVILIPLGFIFSSLQQKKIFISFFTLFIIANLFRLSFRIEHNHSLLNVFLIVANFYIAYAIIRIAKYRQFGFMISTCLFFLLTISGFINLMAVKNDFAYPLADAPTNALMQWIKVMTRPNAIFLSRQEILDPITLSGRRNYFGHTYYLSVMGYDIREREKKTQRFFEATDVSILEEMRKENIEYIAIPVGEITDFHYMVHKEFFDAHLARAYTDIDVVVYKL